MDRFNYTYFLLASSTAARQSATQLSHKTFSQLSEPTQDESVWAGSGVSKATPLLVLPTLAPLPSFVVSARLPSPHGPSKTALSPHFDKERHQAQEKLLTPKRLWHQKSADTRKSSASEKVLTRKGSSTRKDSRHQKSADTRNGSGTRKALVLTCIPARRKAPCIEIQSA